MRSARRQVSIGLAMSRLAPLRFLFLVGITAISCAAPSDATRRAQANDTGTGVATSGCQLHIQVHGSAFWAKELGQSEMRVQQNHRINLWEQPGSDRGRKTGELLVGSRAVVLEEASGAYRVKSPLDDSIGWVTDIQVERTLKQDVATRRPC